MNNKPLTSHIKQLKLLSPDAEFHARSKAEILGSSSLKLFSASSQVELIAKNPQTTWTWRVLALTGAFAIFTIVAVGVTKLLKNETDQEKITAASLDSINIKEEFNKLNINIQIAEIKYQEVVDQTIASALKEVSETKTNHLNQSVLEKEKENIIFNEASNPEIDKLLNEITL